MPEHLQPEFANTPTPWLPDETFWQQNADVISTLQDRLVADYPHTTEALDFDPSSPDLPPDEQRSALWKIMYGRQHGDQLNKGSEPSEKVLIPYGRQPYQYLVEQLRYGLYPMASEVLLDPAKQYDTVFMPSEGSPLGQQQQIDVARATENTSDIVILTGQRLRGGMNAPSETASPQGLVDLAGEASGVDMDKLTAKSSWIRAQLAKKGEGWNAPFASEHDVIRLAAEAGYADQIDWKRYDSTVEERLVRTIANEEIVYNLDGQEIVVPMRALDVVTYQLKSGQRLHVTNGPVEKRPNGEWRATAESTARAAVVGGIALHQEGRYASIATAPHLRTGLDTLIPLVKNAAAGLAPSVQSFDLASTRWNKAVTPSLTAALGETMATMKADRRLREAYRGGDPDSAAMKAI